MAALLPLLKVTAAGQPLREPQPSRKRPNASNSLQKNGALLPQRNGLQLPHEAPRRNRWRLDPMPSPSQGRSRLEPTPSAESPVPRTSIFGLGMTAVRNSGVQPEMGTIRQYGKAIATQLEQERLAGARSDPGALAPARCCQPAALSRQGHHARDYGMLYGVHDEFRFQD